VVGERQAKMFRVLNLALGRSEFDLGCDARNIVDGERFSCMSCTMKPKWTTLIAGLSLLIGWVQIFFLPSVPNGSVYPIWFWNFFFLSWFLVPTSIQPNSVLASFIEGASFYLTMMSPVLFFFAWNPRLFVGSVHVPRRSYALFVVGAALSVYYFYFAWNEGLRVQGFWYTFSLFAADVSLVVALGFIFARKRREEPSFISNLFLHWALCGWLFWFAFPFLGQLSLP
jgi:hypothetical protein